MRGRSGPDEGLKSGRMRATGTSAHTHTETVLHVTTTVVRLERPLDRKSTIVGVNKFQVEEEAPKDLLRVDASVGVNQSKKTQAVRANRDQAAVDKALAALKAGAADENVNLMPLILDAVKTYATLGEICNVLREVFGEYEAHSTL